jgi:eukaryotic-like serine/threonine-protein kinase
LPAAAAPKVAVPAAPKPSPAAGQEMWRVIAFTYRTRDAAANKVHQINRHHPGLNATVFSTNDKKGYYLVSLGGRMTREEAVRLQRSARGQGLPRDLYVQNYSE